MEKRIKIQAEASLAIKQNKFNCMVNISPRVGKTKLMIDVLNTVSKPIKVLILAPLIPIFESWQKEIIKWKLNPQITVSYCWSNSLKKDKTNYDLIIADEIHCYSKEVLIEIRKHQFYGCRVVGLTGTLNESTEDFIRGIIKIQKVFDYPFSQAILDGIVADYQIVCVSCELDNTNAYIKSGKPPTEFLQTELQAYKYWDKRFDDAKEKRLYKQMKNIVSKRANIIYNSQSKLLKTLELVESIDRTLIFTGRAEIADKIGQGSYHGKSNKTNLDKFSKGQLNKLSVISMISMGITIPDLKTLVFNQVKSVEALLVQQVMRALNMEDGKKGLIYIVYLKNTVDEVWMLNALEGFDKSKIKFI